MVEKVRFSFVSVFSYFFPNLLTSRGRLLNIFVTSDTTVVRWAASEPALLAY